MPPIVGSAGAASAKGFGFCSSSLGKNAWLLVGPDLNGLASTPNSGMAVDQFGNIALTRGNTGGSSGYRDVIVFFDKNGDYIRNYSVQSYYDWYTGSFSSNWHYINAKVNNNSSPPQFGIVAAGNYYDPYGIGAFTSTSSSPAWGAANKWVYATTGYNYDNTRRGAIPIPGTNDWLIVPFNPTIYAGKYTAPQTMAARINSSGQQVWYYRTDSFDYTISALRSQNFGAIRTDGLFVILGCQQNSSDYAIVEYSLATGLNNNSNQTKKRFTVNGVSSVKTSYPFFDSSNNLYICGNTWQNPTRARIIKFDSGYNFTAAYDYDMRGVGATTTSYEYTTSFDFYNNKIYAFQQINTSGVFAISRIDASSLDSDWTLQIDLPGWGFIRTTSYGSGGAPQSIFVNSEGIWLNFIANYGGVDYTLVMKLPLDGIMTSVNNPFTVPSPSATLYASFYYYTPGSPSNTTRTSFTIGDVTNQSTGNWTSKLLADTSSNKTPIDKTAPPVNKFTLE